jgi:hypothetical protein
MPYSLSSQSCSRCLTLKQLPTLERVILTLVIKRLLFGCSRVSQSKTNGAKTNGAQAPFKGRIKMEPNYEPAESEPYDIEAAEAYDDYMADQYDVEKDRLGE